MNQAEMVPAVIVTGAGKGIGRAITERCLQDGFRVLACDISAKDLASLKSSYPTSDLSITTIDIADHQQVLAFFEQAIKNQENLACLVNNAGIYLGKNILNIELNQRI